MIKKALLKTEKEYNYINFVDIIKIKKIDVSEKIIDYGSRDSHLSWVFKKNTRINDFIIRYLQVKEKMWFNKSYLLIFIVLRKFLGKDMARFIHELSKLHIKFRIEDNLNEFKKMCVQYKNKKYKYDKKKIIDELFALCEFTQTIDFA